MAALRIEELGAIIIHPKPAFLDQDSERYRVYLDEIVLYRDADHLTATGSIKMLTPLLEKYLIIDHASHQHKSKSGEQGGTA
jgi:hypothetical protein